MKKTVQKNKMHIAIIGGGMAGLSAATALAEEGIKTSLFEAGPHFGGRARSVAIEFNSQTFQVDNGQHILLGAYQETLKLLTKVGVDEQSAFTRLPLALNMLSAHNKPGFKLNCDNFLPHPINQLFGFLCCQGLGFSERISTILLMARLKKISYRLTEDEPLNDFLLKNGQSHQAIKVLWEPLCLAALNTPIELASSKVFLNVLADAFSHHKTDSDFLIPKLDLSQILSTPITRYLQEKGTNLLTNKRIRSIKPSENGYEVSTRLETVEFSHVIIATAGRKLKELTVDLPKLDFITSQTEQYEDQPIYTIYLQYPRHTVLAQPMLGLVDSTSQWVFDRGQLCGQHGLMAVVISAQGKHQKLTQDMLALKVAQELHHVFPHLPKPLWHKVIAEKRATFSCNVNLPRPANVTPYSHLYLAGDYTYADYPATIEGAIRSGLACANLILK
ncbi:MAG: hydroxysqualene dehydroxylase HpnE [Pseudomonadota bacterium]